jgi:hypothetical protein
MISSHYRTSFASCSELMGRRHRARRGLPMAEWCIPHGSRTYLRISAQAGRKKPPDTRLERSTEPGYPMDATIMLSAGGRSSATRSLALRNHRYAIKVS